MNTKAPFPWYGGKQYLVDLLLQLVPPHTTYVEVFGGAASLLFCKKPAKLDVYNDIDSGLVNFFRVLRDRRRSKELRELLRLTPYAREEWAECAAGWQDAATDVEMARQWFVVVSASFAHHFEQTGWKRTFTPSSNCVAAFRSNIRDLEYFTERMQCVQVEHLDASETLRQYDTPETLFYVDPPYVHLTRGHRKAYHHEMTDGDHQKLLGLLPTLRGKVLLSGYRHPIYDDALTGWLRVDRHHARAAALKRAGQKRTYATECIWVSPNAARHQPQLPFGNTQEASA